jgi:hypothetical protein
MATPKRPDRTMVIDTDEHFSYLELAAALSGVRSMHRSSVYHRARPGLREPIRLASSDGRARIAKSGCDNCGNLQHLFALPLNASSIRVHSGVGGVAGTALTPLHRI